MKFPADGTATPECQWKDHSTKRRVILGLNIHNFKRKCHCFFNFEAKLSVLFRNNAGLKLEYIKFSLTSRQLFAAKFSYIVIFKF